MIRWVNVKGWTPEPFESVLIYFKASENNKEMLDGMYIGFAVNEEEDKECEWWFKFPWRAIPITKEVGIVTHWTLLPDDP